MIKLIMEISSVHRTNIFFNKVYTIRKINNLLNYFMIINFMKTLTIQFICIYLNCQDKFSYKLVRKMNTIRSSDYLFYYNSLNLLLLLRLNEYFELLILKLLVKNQYMLIL